MDIKRTYRLEATISLSEEEVSKLTKEIYRLPKVTKALIEQLLEVKRKVSKKQGRPPGRKPIEREDVVEGVKAFILDKVKKSNYLGKTEIFKGNRKMALRMYNHCQTVLEDLITEGKLYAYTGGKEVRGRKKCVYSVLKPNEVPRELSLFK